MVRTPVRADQRRREPGARAVVLGASNVSRGLGALVLRARSGLGPVDLLVACGRGRSYGRSSRFLLRDLPPITECGLWRALDERPPLPLRALVTDVGNDVLYGADAATIATWVGSCVERLLGRGARVALTALPMSRVAGIGPREYAFWSGLFFPGRAVPRARALATLTELDARLRELARDSAVELVEPRGDWYGLDPVHLRPARVRAAWDELLAPWGGPRGLPPRRWGLGLGLNLLAPEERAVLGRARRRAQPARRFGDGTRLSLF